jgi:hypothetical protein
MYRTVAGALILVLLSAFAPAAAAHSPDVGSVVDVAAIRHDLPILMSADLNGLAKPTKVEWVVTNGHRAMASWLAQPYRGIVALVKRNDRWWWAAGSTRTPDGLWSALNYPIPDVGGCAAKLKWPPSAKEALTLGYIGKSMYPALYSRLRTTPLPPMHVILIHYCDGGEAPDSGDYIVYFQISGGVDGIRYPFVKRDSQQQTNLFDKNGRYDFNVIAVYDPKIAPKASLTHGAVLRLWAPFVLDESKTYVLDVSGIEPPIAGLRGSLKENILIFALPAFTLRAQSMARGTIRREP